MAQPPNGTPGLPGQDYVDMPGVTPITPQSFPAGSPPNPNPGQVTLDPVQISAPMPRQVSLDPVEISGVIPANKKPPVAGLPGAPPSSFVGSPLDARQGVAADANILASMADTYRKLGDAQAQGKFDEAQRHSQFAQEQEQSLGESKALWQQGLADQAAREKHMDTAIAKGRQLSVDPDNYWNRKGTASNILAAISVGLGSFASGMTHGATGNPALTMVNEAINRDIASQKDNIDNYWRAIQQQQHLDDNAFNKTLVTQNMMSNMRLAGMKVYESDLKAIQAKTDSQVVKLGAQKQIDDLQLAMNNERKALGATIAAQQAAAAAQMNKDSDAFNKDTLDYMKEHPGMSPQDAAKDVAAINPARTARLGSRSALPQAAQEDFVYGKETGYANAFNQAVGQVARQNIKDYEKKMGHAASEEDKAAIVAQTSAALIKQHPEFGKFQFFRPGADGSLVDIRPQAVKGDTSGGPDRRSKEQIAKDQEREVYIDVPVIGPNGQPSLGTDGKPLMQKVKQLAVTKEAADRYNKWSNLAPTIKSQMAELKAAWQAGDVAKYEALRGAIIEKLPAMYGFERGPSSAQVEHTFKDLIPDYQHWYTPSITASPLGQGRDAYMNQKLDAASKELDSLGEDMRTNTFGPGAGPGRSVGSYGQAVPQAAPSVTPPGLAPQASSDVGVPGTGTKPTTWIDTRPDSPTYGQKLNIVRGLSWTYLEDPRTGKGEKVTPELEGIIQSNADTKAYSNRYGFQPNKK